VVSDAPTWLGKYQPGILEGSFSVEGSGSPIRSHYAYRHHAISENMKTLLAS
jgi:hypothetical protein